MTTLYRPVLIETAAQAEALPVGTVSFDRPRNGGIPEASVKGHSGKWSGTRDGLVPYESAAMVGDYALVPVEAEEETRVSEFHVGTISEDGVRFDDRTGEPTKHERRLVTPWTEEDA